MKRDGWYLTTLGHAFTPDEQTLRDMDHVFIKYDFPVHPTSKQTSTVNTRKRPICENYKEVSPLRRRRRIYDDRADEGNILPIDNNIMPAENVMLENACANEANVLENACANEEQGPLFVVGEGVNVKTSGDPYLAGFITKIEGDDIYIKFPLGRFARYEYKYQKDSILPYTTQFPNGKFTPIKLVYNKPVASQRKKIKDYEERLARYFNTPHD